MNSADTTYGNGLTTTRTSINSIPTGLTPQSAALLRFAYEMAQRRGSQQPQAMSVSAPAPPVQALQASDPMDEEVRAMDARRRILEDQEAERPAPMRMVTGAGIVPGYVMDPNAMSANQRKMFLPQGSQIAGWDRGGDSIRVPTGDGFGSRLIEDPRYGG